jgi:hypothetical protein
VLRGERRAATRERIVSGRLPIPRWITVHPDSRYTGRCDGCGDQIGVGDYAFTVQLRGELIFHFHDECFDVYNYTPGLP